MKKQYVIYLMMFLWAACSGNSDQFKVQGLVEGQVTPIKSMGPGKVSVVHVTEGMPVEKDAPLVELDRKKIDNILKGIAIGERELENGLNSAREKILVVTENVKFYETQLRRMKKLNREDAVSGSKLEEAELGFLKAKSALLDLKSRLRDLELKKERFLNEKESVQLMEQELILRSPTGGIVLDLNVTEGEVLLPGSMVASVLDLSSLYIEAFIEEREMAKLKLKDPVRIKIDGIPEFLTGTICDFGHRAEFSPKYIISETERKVMLFKVKIALTEGKEFFKLGMPVTLLFGND